MQAFAWPLILQAGGLAEISGSALSLTKKGATAMKKPLADRIKALFSAWEKTRIIDEFSRVSLIKGQTAAKGRTMATPVRRRPVLNEALSRLEPNRWVTVEELDRFIRSQGHEFDMINLDWKLYIGNLQYGSLSYYNTWPLLQFRYLLTYLFEYCATLGLMDVAYREPHDARQDFRKCWGADDAAYLSPHDGLSHIRLTDLGAYVLGLTDDFGAPDPQAFTLKETRLVYAGKGSPPADTLLYLSRIADQPVTNQWEFTRGSIVQALKNGETLKDIRAFIRSLKPGKTASALIHLLDTIEATTTAVMDKGQATLLECRPDIIKHILADPKTNRLCLPAGDRHLVILPGQEDAFIGYLESMGFILPRNDLTS